METNKPVHRGWLRAASLVKGAARLSAAGVLAVQSLAPVFQQRGTEPALGILSGRGQALLSQLFFLFLLILPLGAVWFSGDLLAAYCRMRGETGRDCSLGEYLVSPEGWTALRSLAGKTLASYLLPLLVCGLLMLLVQALGLLQPMVDIWRDSWRP